MPTTATCIARYRADSGVFADPGVTQVTDQSAVYQWNDLTGNGHHLIQTDSAKRPVFRTMGCRKSITFDGNIASLNLPTSLNLPGSGCAVLICSRGTGPAIITIGSLDPFSYGSHNGPPDGMAITDTDANPFPKQTYLPTITPIVHGFCCTTFVTRLCVGTNQTSDLVYDTSTFNSSGGAVGSGFAGELYELAIFSPAPDESTLQGLIAALQDSNAISDVANSDQMIFVGDSNLGSSPAAICHLQGDLLKPLVLAQPSHTIAQQLATVNAQMPTLDLTPFAKTIALVCAGSNDALAGRTNTQILADLSALCLTLRSLAIKVIIATVPDPTLSSLNVSLINTSSTFADALVDWASDARLYDASNPASAKDNIKAALTQSAMSLLLNPPETFYPLTYASFYSAGQTFGGSFGHFVQS